MEVAAAPASAGRARRPRIDGWAAIALAVAGLVALPLLTVPASFLSPRVGEWWAITRPILPATVLDTALVGLGVAAGTLVLGVGLAALVSFYDFPGRRLLDWALVLPLAIPPYVLAFVLVAALEPAGAVGGLVGPGFPLPDLRSVGGAVLVLTLALYPYPYLLARGAFLAQSGSAIEAGRSLGLSRRRALARIALPMARPAIAAGVALAVMEALADFGAVQLLGVRTFTVSIYQVWFNAFDRLAATQLATLLLAFTLTLLAFERLMRGRARYAQNLARGRALEPARLPKPLAAIALAGALAVLGAAFLAPVAQLAAWAVSAAGADAIRSELADWTRNSVVLSLATALVAVLVATVLVYGLRVAPSRLSSAATRFAAVGYGLPGSVVAVGVVVTLGFADRRLNELLGGVGLDARLLFTGTALGLIFAYLVRFLAVAFGAVEARMQALPRSLDEAARGLGADRLGVLARVHLPLLRPALLTAALLVFVETMKELPATVLLRPVGGDTLAVGVWEATSESLWQTAALPALLIVAVGLLPVLLVARLSDARGPAAGPEAFGTLTAPGAALHPPPEPGRAP